MKPTEILTAALAVYAAILSSVNIVIAIRAKRWRVAVTYSLGGDSVTYRAVNLGERVVALRSFAIKTIPKRLSPVTMIRKRLSDIGRPHGIRITGTAVFSDEFVVDCVPPLPLELAPGRACEMTLDQRRVLDFLFAMSFTRIATIRGVFEDERGVSFRSPIAKLDWERKAIGFP